MGYYDWKIIVKKYSNDELKKVYRERNIESNEKVECVIKELINRKLFDSEKNELISFSESDKILEIPQIKGRTLKTDSISKILNFILWISLVLDIVLIISFFVERNLLWNIYNNEYYNENFEFVFDQLLLIFNIFIVIIQIVFFIFFLIWLFKLYNNLNERYPTNKFDVEWSIFAWFVPIISIFRPYNIVSEINKKSKYLLEQRQLTRVNVSVNLIRTWWALLMIIAIFSFNFRKWIFNLNGIKDYIKLNTVTIILLVLNLSILFLTLIMVKRFSINENALYDSEQES